MFKNKALIPELNFTFIFLRYVNIGYAYSAFAKNRF